MKKTDETLPGSIITYLVEIMDTIVLMYIGIIIPPFDHYSSSINRNIRQHLIKWGIALPSSFASGNLMYYYSRAALLLVVPTVMLLATTHQRIIPSLLILLNYLGGIFDYTDYFTTTNTLSAVDRFHVLSTGSAQCIPSWTYLQVRTVCI
jgi:hypothetical protein